MTLRSVVNRKLFNHSGCNKVVGYVYPHYVIYMSGQCRTLDRCFIHSPTLILSSHAGFRLLSISLNKCNIFSRLTAYFTQKKLKSDDSLKEAPVNHPNESSQEQTQTDESSRSLMHKPIWMSLVDKLSPSSPYSISTPLSTVLKENQSTESEVQKRSHFRKEILESTETFLQQYKEDLDVILKKATPPVVRKSKKKLKNCDQPKADEKTSVIKNIKYPKVKPSKNNAIKTPRFDETKQFLQSLGIPTDDLETYPNIQEMDRDTILTCVNMLKEKGIHVVFCLFLIDRISLELNLWKRGAWKRKSKKLPITSYQQVKAYLELCQLLDTPDLDIRNMLEQFATFGFYPDILVLHKRVKKLRAIGASAEDILSNLNILQGYEIFDEKVELYQTSPYAGGEGPFPVHLFLCRTVESFKEKLALGDEIDEVAKLLDVSVIDFQTCWGFRCNSFMLQYKVQMCLNAGISKKDIFNNLDILMALPLEKCHAVTSSFRDSGLPASVFVLKEMVDAAELNGNGNRNNSNTCDGSNDLKCTDTGRSHEHAEEDWMGEVNSFCPDQIQVLPEKNHAVSLRKNEVSTRKQRRSLFNLIQNLLSLDKSMIKAMCVCDVSSSTVEMQDVPRNLEFLESLNYSKENIAKCPFILAHSHSDLVRVVKEAESLVLKQIQSATREPSSSYMTTRVQSPDYTIYRNTLHAGQLQRLNTFQYLLEKEVSFSMASTDNGRHVEFLNI